MMGSPEMAGEYPNALKYAERLIAAWNDRAPSQIKNRSRRRRGKTPVPILYFQHFSPKKTQNLTMRPAGWLLPVKHSECKKRVASTVPYLIPLPARHFAERIALW
jgi:hypothetical protein